MVVVAGAKNAAPPVAPYIGPMIRVDWMATTTNDNRRGRGVRATRDIRAGELLFVLEPLVSAPVQKVYAEWRPAKY